MNAKGTFDVKLVPQEDRPIPALARMTIDKTFAGDMEGSSQGQMLSGGDPKSGSAGYVAMERFEGSVHGKRSFILQHNATMHDGAQTLHVAVVPASGTGELKGISGSLDITIKGGTHYYDLNYRIPSLC